MAATDGNRCPADTHVCATKGGGGSSAGTGQPTPIKRSPRLPTLVSAASNNAMLEASQLSYAMDGEPTSVVLARVIDGVLGDLYRHILVGQDGLAAQA